MDLGRSMSAQTVFLHEAIAQSVGLNATDTKCIDLIMRHEPCTPGQLAELTGLTTGAIAHILNRLEKRRFIERTRDAKDRRKVIVHIRPESLEPLIPKYEAIGEAYMELAAQFSEKELAVIADYMERTSAVSQKLLAGLVAQKRATRQND
jgi:DNA-binding MarR family transcriptional regulator